MRDLLEKFKEILKTSVLSASSVLDFKMTKVSANAFLTTNRQPGNGLPLPS